MTTTSDVLVEGFNGNAYITIYSDGTRIIDYEDELRLEYPLNVDIKLSSKCIFGKNSNGKSVCHFCHESALVDGLHGNLSKLLKHLSTLPTTTEIAIGLNNFENKVIEDLLEPLANRGYIVNVTVNQGLLITHSNYVKYLIDQNIIKGLGISYRKGMKQIPQFLLEYSNTVLHSIVGIDTIEDLLSLDVPNKTTKLLILGEKDFGANLGQVDLNSEIHKTWKNKFVQLFKKYSLLSFDNLALQQLNVKKLLNQKEWDVFYQHEYSFYIDAVSETFSPSSRSAAKVDFNSLSIKEYFKQL